uniref:LRAT domain-containing protein n=1 Tax=Marmota marmota marmota TaxID=9994 RepID=A0A8C5Z1W0_MARMA
MIFLLQDRRKPKRGDLIEIFCGGFEHWAIYVGKGYVVHLASPIDDIPSKYSIPCVCGVLQVTKELLSVVAGGDAYRINNKNNEEYDPLPPQKVVQQAEKMVGKEVSYSVTSNNCEHFVNALRYRVSRSDQCSLFCFLRKFHGMGLFPPLIARPGI